MNVTWINGTDAVTPSAAVQSAWTTAANTLASMFTDNINITITVNYSGSGGTASYLQSGFGEPYQSVYNYLTSHASPGDTTFASLPNTTTIDGYSDVLITSTQAALMGIGINSSNATVTFATDIPASEMVAVALREFTESFGRFTYGDGSNSINGSPSVEELFRYTSPGNRLFSAAMPAQASYFSVNGGLSDWADYGRKLNPDDTLNAYSTGGDPASALTPEDAFDQAYDASSLQYLTPYDLAQMDALGFHLKYDAPAANPADFTGSGTGDVLVQSNGNGSIDYAVMSGGAFQSWAAVGGPAIPGFSVVGQGKIEGTAQSNIVIENAGGAIDYIGLNGSGTFSAFAAVGNAPGFNVVGVGDINDDHYADVVVQNPTSGEVDYANMQNGVFHSWQGAGPPVQGWNVVGVGDVNDDGYADIVIQNPGTGQIAFENMNGGSFGGFVNVGFTPGWTVKGVGDINRDGYADIVIQNPTTGQIAYGNMANGTLQGWVNVGTTPNFTVAAVEDVIGNGFPDIVIQNTGTGEIDYAAMTTGTFQGWGSVGTAPGFTTSGMSALTAGLSAAPVSASSLGLSADAGTAVLSPATLQMLAAYGVVTA